MFGCGSVAQVVLSRGTHGGFLTINLAFGFAVTLGILIAGQVSGKALLYSQSSLLNSILTRGPTVSSGGMFPWGRRTFPRPWYSYGLSSEPFEEESGEGT